VGGLRSVSACRPHIGHCDGVGVSTGHRPPCHVAQRHYLLRHALDLPGDQRHQAFGVQCKLTIRWIDPGYVFDGGFGHFSPRHSGTHDLIWPIEPGDHTLVPQPIQL
jgi:hypothetical protein